MFYLCHKFPILSLIWGLFSPPHLSPVPIGLRLTLCRGGGALWGAVPFHYLLLQLFLCPRHRVMCAGKAQSVGAGTVGSGRPHCVSPHCCGEGLGVGCWEGGLWGDSPSAKGHSCWNPLHGVEGGVVGTPNQGVCVPVFPIRGTY